MKKKSGTLYILAGLPGSGKSTYAKEILLKAHPNWYYVSRDEVRYKYVSDQKHYFDHEGEVYREFCNQIEMYLLRGETVIADATHLNEKSRQRLLNTMKTAPEKLYLVCMTTPFEISFERNSKREGITRVPDDQMYRMKRLFKAPSGIDALKYHGVLGVNGSDT